MKLRIIALVLAIMCLLSTLEGCAPAPAAEQDVSEKVAGVEEMTEVVDVTEPGMEPVYADALRDGKYPVEMKSSSSMFKADHVALVVENGQMRAQLYMTSKSYLYLYADSAARAASADESDYIPLKVIDEELPAFVLPVKALDAGIPCAAFSKKKEKWYDRTLLFRADSLPVEAFRETRGTSIADLNLAEGTYSAEVQLSGGSGRASVESPAVLTISLEGCTARIVWSSPNYDFMVVDGVRYDPVNTGGNSTFEIPVAVFDAPMSVQADTTAMSQPYLIDYTLRFDSATVKSAP